MLMMLFCILVGLVLANSYCRADDSEMVKRQTTPDPPAWSTIVERIERIEKMLEYGGKQYHSVEHDNTLQLRDHDYLRLQFMGTWDNNWLGCPDAVCDLRTCDQYSNFETCLEVAFQIIGEGTQNSPIKSGQQIRLRYLNEHNSWMACWHNYRCDKRTCPGTTTQAANFGRCLGTIFRIYARGRANGEIIYNGDLVMLYAVNFSKYVSISFHEGGDTVLDICPGLTPPAYLSYGICSINVFRIYRRQ